ncbi:MAG: beta-ketoacyl-[acyl-carrier-protein] synthase family protein [Methyloceanibacter sp.]|uniref:beta-ketoacyl-[acyl-carrier-protein] synthase family protein n=1 Tax=Methyloceanibacter sp. TaxID=1965321 RepID=UPI001DFDEDEA|nr:beta-ketoacyl-[acyl-carrier-protein] synthase family protein [Methyloceanibacter sp.]MCB1442588.1 beta-ketoacyl-[acyl-carrier-protein] synthase family protein [Methyloceanibacter sp.]MCC0058328.1 beta-ketoacyl-[acyl-carrier-protein] synthase family protein [Hyphomicrobiaceae bacterium]
MTHSNGRRRVVVTGQGVVTPLGTGVDKFWSGLKSGTCGIREVQSFETDELYITIAGEVPDFDPRERELSKQLLMADKYSQYAGCAAREAVAQSGLETPISDADAYRTACVIGSGVGGLTTLEFSYKMLFKENKRATHPLTLLKAIGSSASAHVSIEYGVKGPTFGVVSACSTATHSIGVVYQMIRSGLVDTGIAGAAEASLNWGATRAWQAMRVLSPDGLFPFSKTRNGTVLAEGSGILVLEEYEKAKARGAPILAELMGFGMTADAADMVNPSIDGASTAMQIALDDAQLAPSDIDYINAHGTATAVNDVNETRAIKHVFGNAANNLSISSTKSMHGHTLGACGGIEAAASIKALEENFIPPTIGLKEPDPECDLDYTPNEGKKRDVNYVMSNSFAFGGLNAVLVFGPNPA